MLAEPRAESPRARAAVSETMERLKEAVGDLSPLARAVFNLRYSEDMNVKDIAKTLDRKPGAIAVMLHRAQRSSQSAATLQARLPRPSVDKACNYLIQNALTPDRLSALANRLPLPGISRLEPDRQRSALRDFS